jgi:putative oxidoreductase
MVRQSSRQYAVDAGLTVLRVVIGVIMAAHGWQKLWNLEQWQQQVASSGIPWPEVSTYLAVAGEFLGGVGLILGLLTPIAALGVVSVLLVAIVTVHLPHGLFAKNNGFELPLSLMAAAVYFVVRGAGPWSLDALLFRSGSRKVPPKQPARKIDPVIEAGEESFPASDPPSFTPEKST